MKILLTALLVVGTLLGGSSAVQAQTETATFTLEDVWFYPDIANPRGLPPQQMTGTFVWTYDIGDFENGSGVFSQMYIPYYGSNLSDIRTTIDLTSIEFSLIPNVHGFSVDGTLFLLNPLSRDQPAVVDPVRSVMEYEDGVTTKGHFTSGSVDPESRLVVTASNTCPNLQVEVQRATTHGKVALLFAFGTGATVIPNGKPCAGTVLGLDNTVAVAAVLTADANGSATVSRTVPPNLCGTVFLQALDLTTCTVSWVEPVL